MSNYPSCIKIPVAESKQYIVSTVSSQKIIVKEMLAYNNKLIALATRIFGEAKWSHTVTNQTIESHLGKHVCGCATFVRIQLQNGTFHEDMGYYISDGLTKGLAIHLARAGSLTEAFKRVLLCFGDKIETEIQRLDKNIESSNMPNPQNSNMPNPQNEDLQSSVSSVRSEMLEPCAQSTPYHGRKGTELKEFTETITKSKSLNDQRRETMSRETIPRMKSPIEQKEHDTLLTNLIRNRSPTGAIGQSVEKVDICKPRVKSPNSYKEQIDPQPNMFNANEIENTKKEQDGLKGKVYSEEELLRMERKRKQMEKQAEYKRLMKEREQKSADNKRPNPKY